MGLKKDYSNILSMITQPAFIVSQGKILCCNEQCRPFLPSTDVALPALLITGKEEYEAFTKGCLCLQLQLAGRHWEAAVTCLEDVHVFRLQEPGIPPELKAMSLMSRQLRQNISTLSILANRIHLESPEGDIFRREISRIHRMLNNVSNTEYYLSGAVPSMEETDLRAVLQELTEEAVPLLEQAGFHLEVSLPDHRVFALADARGIRQSVYNLLSNAAKYSPTGGTIVCKVIADKHQLRVSITNEGTETTTQQPQLFSRYTRQPTLEENRNDLGLGLALVRAVASAHNGCVLWDTPKNTHTRITLTVALTQPTESTMRSPTKSILVSSANEGLIMLSDVLPPKAYQHML